ncbi:hypothetical protein RAD15_09840 [Bradyrhizobium sp. 14AA]
MDTAPTPRPSRHGHLRRAQDPNDPEMVGQKAVLARAPDPDSQRSRADIASFIERHNADDKTFLWTKSADDILASIERF